MATTDRIELALEAVRQAQVEVGLMVTAKTPYEQGLHQGAAETYLLRAETALREEREAVRKAFDVPQAKRPVAQRVGLMF